MRTVINLITSASLWSAVAQTAMAAAVMAADAPPPAPMPPLPTAEVMPAPHEAGPVQAKPPELGSPTPTAPEASPAPAPEAEAVPSPAGGDFIPRGCGCRSLDCCEWPFGACTRAAFKTQICNGLAGGFVLYEYDFCDAAACDNYKLSPKGYERLADIARMFPCMNFHPILIESTPHDAKLDAARREYVWKQLLQLNSPVPFQLVVVGHPRTPALRGDEADIIYKNLLKQTESSGAASTGGGGGAGVSGGAGASGGAASTPTGGGLGIQ